jgi:hypothetical protein
LNDKDLPDSRPKKKPPYPFLGCNVSVSEVAVKKPRERFQAVPLVEVLKKATEINGHELHKKPAKKEEPYSVRIPGNAGK